jgi:hypothetical protein
MQRRHAIGLIAAGALSTRARAQNHLNSCTEPVYLTFDTGHMGVASFVADVLRRQRCR